MSMFIVLIINTGTQLLLGVQKNISTFETAPKNMANYNSGYASLLNA